MSLIIKICGLTSASAVESALGAGADLIGLVRFARSPRYVPLELAADLASAARGRAESVLVTADMPDDELDASVAKIKPDWIQLHGRETPPAVAAARARTGCRAIKAIGVAGADDMALAERYADVCDMLILDTKPPGDASRPGGLGLAFDWGIAKTHPLTRPYLLSGGLTPDNVARALAASQAPGVDVSSGVESAPGIKDPDLVRRFVEAARHTETHSAEEVLAE